MNESQTGQPAPKPDPVQRKTRPGLLWLRIAAWTVAAGISLLVILYILLLFFWKPVPRTYSIALGDLDGDGDLDAFYANGENEGSQPNTVLINQGGAQGGQPGELQDSGQRLGKEESRTVALADLDGDGDLDAWVANVGYSTLFFNDGKGQFRTNGPPLLDDRPGGSAQWDIALGDLDGDGDLDALGGGCCGAVSFYSSDETEVHFPFNLVWINQGGTQGGQPGNFISSTESFESLGAQGAALGDLDGDGDLDAFFGNDSYILEPGTDLEFAQPNTVWWNDGSGRFIDSGQRLGLIRTIDIALGDLDGDGDLDVFSANYGPDEIWFNTGGALGGRPGQFEDSGQHLGNAYSEQVFLADLDLDGDLDAAVTYRKVNSSLQEVQTWLNDGLGGFSTGGEPISHSKARAFALGDLAGDGTPDLLAGWYPGEYRVWKDLKSYLNISAGS